MRLLLPLLVACGAPDEPAPQGSKPDPLPEVCHDAAPWSPGTKVFRDASAGWGMRRLGANGVRMNAVDFDGDGWTDLAVRSGNDEDDFAAGTRSAWLLRNTGEGTFEDVTEASGIRAPRGGGAHGRRGPVWVWADVDNDGDLDVFTGMHPVASSEDRSEVMLNNGDGTFSMGPKASDLRDATSNAYGAAFTDFDLDGLIDLWTGQNTYESQATQDRLYRGVGDGKFRDRTEAKGLITEPWNSRDALNSGEAHSLAWSAAACDLNNDGQPDLIASSYGRAPNHLWQNDGGSFVNRSVASGYAFDARTDWSDNESARCWCTLHPTDADCAGVPAPEAIPCNEDADAFRWNHGSDREPYRLGGNSGQTVCRDVDNDGWVDLLTTEIVHWDVGSSSDPSELLFNTQESEIRFERPGNEATGLVRVHEINGWNDGDITANTVDFDNDGWPDVYIGSSDYPAARGLLWHQISPRRFEPVAIEDGIDHMRSHGVAVADFDRDGDLDLAVGHSTARCDSDCYESNHVRIFENLSPPGNFVQLKLEGGAGSNAAAIGARVEVTAGGITQVQYVSGGGGQWGAQDDLVLHFGLGEACEADVAVTWPAADLPVERHTVQGGYRWTIHQGEDPVPER